MRVPRAVQFVPSALLVPAALFAQAPLRLTLIDTAVLSAPRLGESSGVAPSRRPGVYWTHNDSGDGPFLYATDSTGRDLGAIRIDGATNVDWEDIARGPCPVPSGTCLYIGDIGDNLAQRNYVIVYVVPEPDPPAGPSDTTRHALAIDSIRLRYPDHPHDAEGLAVTADGRLLVVTKDLSARARLFSTPLAGHGTSPVTLDVVCTLQIAINPIRGRLVTGIAISPDQRWLLARTYVSIHAFALDSACTPLVRETGVGIPVIESQGEGVSFDGPDRIVMTSERGTTGHAIISRYRIAGLGPR
ncbi:MAG: hypothetical protein ACHQX4_12115 [Gemmatimonadales bacterium]